MNICKWPQTCPFKFSCRSRSSNMLGVQPPWRSFLNVPSWNSSTICSLLLCHMTPSHLYSEVLMNLLHRRLNLSSIYTSLISFPSWLFCKRHPGVCTFDRIEWRALRCLGHSIIHSKLCQRKPRNPIILLMVHNHPKILFHTGIHPLHLSVCLRMKG